MVVKMNFHIIELKGGKMTKVPLEKQIIKCKEPTISHLGHTNSQFGNSSKLKFCLNHVITCIT